MSAHGIVAVVALELAHLIGKHIAVARAVCRCDVRAHFGPARTSGECSICSTLVHTPYGKAWIAFVGAFVSTNATAGRWRIVQLFSNCALVGDAAATSKGSAWSTHMFAINREARLTCVRALVPVRTSTFCRVRFRHGQTCRTRYRLTRSPTERPVGTAQVRACLRVPSVAFEGAHIIRPTRAFSRAVLHYEASSAQISCTVPARKRAINSTRVITINMVSS